MLQSMQIAVDGLLKLLLILTLYIMMGIILCAFIFVAHFLHVLIHQKGWL